MSTAIAFRMITYFLPPLWGAVAMRWLRQHAYLWVENPPVRSLTDFPERSGHSNSKRLAS